MTAWPAPAVSSGWKVALASVICRCAPPGRLLGGGQTRTAVQGQVHRLLRAEGTESQGPPADPRLVFDTPSSNDIHYNSISQARVSRVCLPLHHHRRYITCICDIHRYALSRLAVPPCPTLLLPALLAGADNFADSRRCARHAFPDVYNFNLTARSGLPRSLRQIASHK